MGLRPQLDRALLWAVKPLWFGSIRFAARSVDINTEGDGGQGGQRITQIADVELGHVALFLCLVVST